MFLYFWFIFFPPNFKTKPSTGNRKTSVRK